MTTALEILITAVQKISLLLQLLVFASIVITWVRPDPMNPVVRFIRRTTDPAYAFVRRTMPFLRAGAIDFSPVVLLLLITLVSTLIVQLLEQIALSRA